MLTVSPLQGRLHHDPPRDDNEAADHHVALVAEQVRRRILDDIGAGRLIPGQKIGSERQLALDLGVSRSTVRQVLAGMARAGLVTRVTGRAGGTFVCQAKVERDLCAVSGLSSHLEGLGLQPSNTVLEAAVVPADRQHRQSFGLPEDGQVISVLRLRLADGAPLGLERLVFPACRFDGLAEEDLSGSVSDLLAERYATHAARARETLEVVAATPREAGLLQVPVGSALFSTVRVRFDSRGRPFQSGQMLYRADRTRFTALAEAD